MDSPTHPDDAGAVGALLECGALKAWSLIVTILGDLAAGPGARVSGPVLSALTERMGLKPEAQRVAIHRLRRDGWMTSERDGRNSLYGLSDHGRALTLSVVDRIYGPAPDDPGDWHIVIAASAEAMQALDHADIIPLSARAALLPGPSQGLPETVLAWLVMPGAVPAWVRDILMPPDLAASYGDLVTRLDIVLAAPLPELAIDRAALRLLALHQWRRLVLRHGAPVEALMPAGWPGASARSRIAAVVARLPRPDPGDLARALAEATS